MKICYHCDICGGEIATLWVGTVDEAKFGFDCLTEEERRDIINVDDLAGTMHVKSLCDDCIALLGLDGEPAASRRRPYLH